MSFLGNHGDTAQAEKRADDLPQGYMLVEAKRTQDEQSDGHAAVGADWPDADIPASYLRQTMTAHCRASSKNSHTLSR
jgi:hypothetical protein